ncbi:MAG: hypothetical protein PHH54_00800 [Candidatus Nanoarchaeia archaeon]|nr:hypothetical protein [Candidatus Nanoarchaeia archaeon]MDD5740501.1 hypothetical protein [Candidatus Nanoarchaeia archaeon]
MNFKKYLEIGFVTAVLALTTNISEARGLEQKINQAVQTQQTIKQEKLSAPELIRAATLEDSIIFVNECKDNTPFKQQIEKYGLKKTYEHLAKMKSYSISLAEKYCQEPNEIPEKEYLAVSKQIGQDDLNFYKGHTNPLDKEVIKARAKTVKIAAECHKKILSKMNSQYENKDVSETYENLVRNTLTETEYTEYCEQMSDSMDEYYEALADTLGWKIIIGRGDINKMKKASRDHYFAVRNKIYNKNEN